MLAGRWKPQTLSDLRFITTEPRLWPVLARPLRSDGEPSLLTLLSASNWTRDGDSNEISLATLHDDTGETGWHPQHASCEFGRALEECGLLGRDVALRPGLFFGSCRKRRNARIKVNVFV